MWVKRWIYVEEPSSGTTSTTETANYGTTRLATNNTTTTDGYTKIVCFDFPIYRTCSISNEEDIDEVWLGIIDRYNREGQKRDQKEARRFYNSIVQNFQVGCTWAYKGMYNKKLMFPNKKVEKWV